MLKKRLPNRLPFVLESLEPFRKQLTVVAVESIYNWCWLVDGLMNHGYPVVLANPAEIDQYNEIKGPTIRQTPPSWPAWPDSISLHLSPLGSACARPAMLKDSDGAATNVHYPELAEHGHAADRAEHWLAGNFEFGVPCGEDLPGASFELVLQRNIADGGGIVSSILTQRAP